MHHIMFFAFFGQWLRERRVTYTFFRLVAGLRFDKNVLDKLPFVPLSSYWRRCAPLRNCTERLKVLFWVFRCLFSFSPHYRLHFFALSLEPVEAFKNSLSYFFQAISWKNYHSFFLRWKEYTSKPFIRLIC